MAAHAESCWAIGVSFVPLVMETLGGWSKQAVHSLSSIGRFAGQKLGSSPIRVHSPPLSEMCHLPMER